MVNVWLFLAAGFALANWIFTGLQRRRFQIISKIAALAMLILWFTVQGGWKGYLVFFGLGLVFGLAGDVLLELPSRFFIFGLGAFLIGHLCYISGFVLAGVEFSPGSLWVAALVLIGAAINFLLLLRKLTQKPENTPMRLPVILYAVVITFMLICAAITVTDHPGLWAAATCVALGAVFFMISDTALAYRVFVQPFRFSGPLVMVTYHLAQGLIAFGALLGIT